MRRTGIPFTRPIDEIASDVHAASAAPARVVPNPEPVIRRAVSCDRCHARATGMVHSSRAQFHSFRCNPCGELAAAFLTDSGFTDVRVETFSAE